MWGHGLALIIISALRRQPSEPRARIHRKSLASPRGLFVTTFFARGYGRANGRAERGGRELRACPFPEPSVAAARVRSLPPLPRPLAHSGRPARAPSAAHAPLSTSRLPIPRAPHHASARAGRCLFFSPYPAPRGPAPTPSSPTSTTHPCLPASPAPALLTAAQRGQRSRRHRRWRTTETLLLSLPLPLPLPPLPLLQPPLPLSPPVPRLLRMPLLLLLPPPLPQGLPPQLPLPPPPLLPLSLPLSSRRPQWLLL